MPEECLSTASAATEPRVLRVCFCRDTLSHVVQLVDEPSATDVFASVDVTVEPWPPSPPWQELHVHEGADVKALMLVGRAGKSHWSMSVSLDMDDRAIVFDVACRLRERPDFLGTTYQLRRTDCQARPHENKDACADVEIRPAVLGGASLWLQVDEIAGAAPATLEVAGDQVIIRAPQPTQPQMTVRWKYRFALREGVINA